MLLQYLACRLPQNDTRFSENRSKTLDDRARRHGASAVAIFAADTLPLSVFCTRRSWLFRDRRQCLCLTGYLLATGILPTLYISFLAVSAESLLTNLFATALSILFGVSFFTRGILLQGHPDFAGRAIGAVLLVGAIVKWIPALQRLMRSHRLVSLLVGYGVGIGVVMVISFGWNQDVWMPWIEHGQLLAYVPVKSDPYTFYQGKALSEFAFWDWAAALAGGIVYVAAARYWKSLLDPSTEIDEAVPPGASKS
jgi:hypothetical protein